MRELQSQDAKTYLREGIIAGGPNAMKAFAQNPDQFAKIFFSGMFIMIGEFHRQEFFTEEECKQFLDMLKDDIDKITEKGDAPPPVEGEHNRS